MMATGSYEPCSKCNGSGMQLDDASVGASYRVIREFLELSLRDLARRLNWSASYISDLELGRRQWNTRIMRKFDQALK